jgi:hypothetical protein
MTMDGDTVYAWTAAAKMANDLKIGKIEDQEISGGEIRYGLATYNGVGKASTRMPYRMRVGASTLSRVGRIRVDVLRASCFVPHAAFSTFPAPSPWTMFFLLMPLTSKVASQDLH